MKRIFNLHSKNEFNISVFANQLIYELPLYIILFGGSRMFVFIYENKTVYVYDANKQTKLYKIKSKKDLITMINAMNKTSDKNIDIEKLIKGHM